MIHLITRELLSAVIIIWRLPSHHLATSSSSMSCCDSLRLPVQHRDWRVNGYRRALSGHDRPRLFIFDCYLDCLRDFYQRTTTTRRTQCGFCVSIDGRHLLSNRVGVYLRNVRRGPRVFANSRKKYDPTPPFDRTKTNDTCCRLPLSVLERFSDALRPPQLSLIT